MSHVQLIVPRFVLPPRRWDGEICIPPDSSSPDDRGRSKTNSPSLLRHASCLDNEYVRSTLKKETLVRWNDWIVVAVLSPYSSLPHVMLVDDSQDPAYCPGPLHIRQEQGLYVPQLTLAVLEALCKVKNVATLQVGYNFSPWSWGGGEELGGFQSVVTKWHQMIWGWPDFGPVRKGDVTKKVDVSNGTFVISPVSKEALKKQPFRARSIGITVDDAPETCHTKLNSVFGTALRKLLEESLDSSVRKRYFRMDESVVDSLGLRIPLKATVFEVFSEADSFSDLHRPLARILKDFFHSLSNAFFVNGGEQLDRLERKIHDFFVQSKSFSKTNEERKIAKARVAGLHEYLRSSSEVVPILRCESEAKGLLKRAGFSVEFYTYLHDAIVKRLRRANHDVAREDWETTFDEWHRGFGYSLVFSSPKPVDSSQEVPNACLSSGVGEAFLRIMPGFFNGPAGVVEACEVLLSRPKHHASREARLEWARQMYALKDEVVRRLESIAAFHTEAGVALNPNGSCLDQEIELLSGMFPELEISNVNQRTTIIVQIDPQTGCNSALKFVSCHMSIEIPSTYPEDASRVSVVKSSGLDDAQLSEFESKIAAAGPLPLWELISFAQSQLTDLNMPTEDCPICFLPFVECEFVKLRCGHPIHGKCLESLSQISEKVICPVCRTFVAVGDIRLFLENGAAQSPLPAASKPAASPRLAKKLSKLSAYHAAVLKNQEEHGCLSAESDVLTAIPAPDGMIVEDRPPVDFSTEPKEADVEAVAQRKKRQKRKKYHRPTETQGKLRMMGSRREPDRGRAEQHVPKKKPS